MSADFTSGLFLGFTHSGGCWPGPLTTGRPAVLNPTAGGAALAAEVAEAQGAGRGLVARSSLHALIDVLVTATAERSRILVDEHAYPISHWAAAVARSKGAEVHTYRHHDLRDARRLARRHEPKGPAPVVVTDGWCGSCLRPAPLPGLRELVGHSGVLVVDDSLAAGVVGSRRISASVLGLGGGGTPTWWGMGHDRLVWVASMAKGLGAPLAVITGSGGFVERLATDGPARTHASAASRCDVEALASAWRHPGLEVRRRRLTATILCLRGGLASLGLPPVGLPFPVVAVESGGRSGVLALHRRLHDRGVETLVVRAPCRRTTQLTICLRADHRSSDVSTLLAEIGRAAA